MSFKPALSSCDKALSDELFQSYAEAGIEAIEISSSLEDYYTMNFQEVKEIAQRHNVKLWSLHLPFAPFEKIDISKPELCEYTIEVYKELIKKGNDVGIKVYVVHPSGEPIDCERKERMECSKKSLKALAEFASEIGCVIAIEDLPRTCLGNCSSDIIKLLSAHKDLRVCFDTNHLLEEDVVDFIEAVGDKIITTHISDCDFKNERHWLPGEGQINWKKLIEALERVGYDGYLLYEIGFKIPWSIDRPRDLNCQDFKNNFDELTAKKIPTPIGKPKQNLGMWEALD